MLALRVGGTICAAALGTQALVALLEASPGAAWNLVPIGFAIAALVLLWRRQPAGLPAILALFATAGTYAFATFGDSTFSRGAAGAIAAVLLAFVGYAYLVLPLRAWRRGRWSTEPMAFTAWSGDAALPAPVATRVKALAGLGFVPRLLHARAEPGATGTLVVLTHEVRDAFANVLHVTANGREFATTRLMPNPQDAARVSLVDVLSPAPFPPPPNTRVLLFPDAPAATLFAHLERLHPHATTSPPLTDDALTARVMQVGDDYDRWLVEAGYLSPDLDGTDRRYTLKGGFSAVLRMLWPWNAMERARRARDGREALRAASGAAA